jgi:hypothetical protein
VFAALISIDDFYTLSLEKRLTIPRKKSQTVGFSSYLAERSKNVSLPRPTKALLVSRSLVHES